MRSARTVAAPFGDVGLPLIDPADIAEVAAAVLRDGGPGGRVIELTGPALVTPREQAGAIGAALGEPVRFVDLPRVEAREQMLRFMPEEVVETTLGILGEPVEAELRAASESRTSSVSRRAPSPTGPAATRTSSAGQGPGPGPEVRGLRGSRAAGSPAKLLRNARSVRIG